MPCRELHVCQAGMHAQHPQLPFRRAGTGSQFLPAQCLMTAGLAGGEGRAEVG